MESPEALVCTCGQPTHFKCDWKTLRFVPVHIRNIRRGDTVRRLGEEDGDRHGVAIVERISDNGVWTNVKLVIRRRSVPDKFKEFMALPASRMQALRPAHCGSPCCPNCHREVWQGRHYCRSHWGSWELPGELDQAAAI